ncbi:hypothetical protein AV530_003298 [Patagioenas fasciata monilis]|uniref:Uncharacterized protein n=1 Tax=Patagioenas fasciata monilis TaxID=372326 RepID=A0A1V4K1W5_PATFA|nr:hypothetical protein AV530_003298 [Patagioenas fasciata monilis]
MNVGEGRKRNILEPERLFQDYISNQQGWVQDDGFPFQRSHSGTQQHSLTATPSLYPPESRSQRQDSSENPS